jgi:hypothetical protein
MVSNTTQPPPPPPPNPPSHTLSDLHDILYVDFGRCGGGGGRGTKDKRGNSSQSWVENTNMTDCVSRLNTSKTTFRVCCLYSYLVHASLFLLSWIQIQEIKWSRGVVRIWFTIYPNLLRILTS